MKCKGKRPLKDKSKDQILTGIPVLGYLNSFYCPICKIHLFSYYDTDIFSVSDDWNYCSKCGTLLDLSEWKREKTRRKMLGAAIVVGAEESIEFD